MTTNPRSDSLDTQRLADALAKAAHWLDTLAATGPDLRPRAHIKVAHEALELAAHPCVEEAADVLIALVGTAQHQHWSVADLADAVDAKVRVNMERVWTQQPDGTWQHDPDAGP